jgi:hypothetical protein
MISAAAVIAPVSITARNASIWRLLIIVKHKLWAFWQANFAFAFMTPPGKIRPVTSSYRLVTEQPHATIRRPKGIKNAANLHAHIYFPHLFQGHSRPKKAAWRSGPCA